MKQFFKKITKPLVFLASFLVLIFAFLTGAHLIQTNGGKVDVKMETLEIKRGDEVLGNVAYKLYVPETATKDAKAPAVLLLHGYQNDHETSAAYAVELARRGVVVLALDEFGHGKSSVSMINRGYVNKKVTTTFGLEKEGETFVEIGGQKRYRVMMNFSNLSFFEDKYTTDKDGNKIYDSSMGGIDAYYYLSSLEFVDASRMGISGHSMGTWASWSVAAELFEKTKTIDGKVVDISPKAVVLQCGELFTKDAYDETKYSFNNVLLLQAKYDEFSYFRDYKNTVTDDLLKTDLRKEFLGVTTDDAKWNTTYGSFSDGSARRIELLYTNHRLATHNSKGMKTSMEWFANTLNYNTTLKSDSFAYQWKEVFVLMATLLSIASMVPVMYIVTATPFFASVVGKVPTREEKTKSNKSWWKGAIITILIAGLTYPFLTQLGHGLLPLPEGVFRMTIGNGFLCWYLFLIIVMLLTTIIPFKKSQKKDVKLDYVDLGLANEISKDTKKLDWKLCGKSALVALIMVAFMYVLVLISEAAFMLDFRYIWPFFKGFTFERFLQFLVYIPVFALFFLLNNSKIFAQMRTKYASMPGAKGFFACLWRNALCMIGGVLLLILIEYIPFFAGVGPGADLLFGSTFGGPFMSLMIVFVPQVIVFSVICTYIYRKTGNVYTGAFTVAMLACWIITGGSAIL